MDALANKKREAAQQLMDQLGDNYTVKVYLCDRNEDKPTEIPEEDYGHFYQDNVYLIDVKGKLRYLIQWFGPRLAGDDVSFYRHYMDILTDYVFAPREIIRVSVQQGHEDNSLLNFFPDGFICHDGKY